MPSSRERGSIPCLNYPNETCPRECANHQAAVLTHNADVGSLGNMAHASLARKEYCFRFQEKSGTLNPPRSPKA